MRPTTTIDQPGPALRHRALGHAIRHYLEMVLAMCAGMLVLGGAGEVMSALLGLPATWGPELDSLWMATTMSIGMAGWMRFRRHGWAPIAQMCAAMFLPFVALFVPLWSGTITPDDLTLWGHVLMLPAMAAVMLLDPQEYTRPHGAR